jgi:glutamyl-tRNA synthetase
VSSVRVRFAPSPTGLLHVGGLRTALYNYLFARSQGGRFLLRIEDTDRSRFVPGAVDNLLETLVWAGLDYDEGPGVGGGHGPYVQSERLDLYRKHAALLLESGYAYAAFETPEELEELRRSQERSGAPILYDRRALRLSPDEVARKREQGVPFVIRLNVPRDRTVVVEDLIRGHVEFDASQIDDQVLLKSDGYPTYHLANVVDDHLMGVSHIIRGEEWLPSTPKHVLLYEYFGWTIPQFAHLPLLLNPDRSKLSKRQGDVAVEDYRTKGILPEALVNFVALLGWNPGTEQELFSMEELIQQFSLDRVGKSGAIFNIDKLRWMNAQHLRRKTDAELVELLRAQVQTAGREGFSEAYLGSVVRLMRERAETPEDLFLKAPYFYEDPEAYDPEALAKRWTTDTPTHLTVVRDGLASIQAFTHTAIEAAVREAASRNGVGAGKIIHPLRLAITGVPLGPGLFELMETLGKSTCLRRIDRALETLPR